MTDEMAAAASGSLLHSQAGLQLPLLATRSRPPILEPVEDVSVPQGSELLEQLADPNRLIFGGVHHSTVEDGLEDEDLFRLRHPPGANMFCRCWRRRRRKNGVVGHGGDVRPVVRIHGKRIGVGLSGVVNQEEK